MRKMCQVFIFTDLDGTLLDSETFSFNNAKKFINEIAELGIKIIPNSSKTSKEIDNFCTEANIDKTFISENGSEICGLNILDKSLPKKYILSRKKEEILKIFQESVETKVKNKCLILSEQSLEKQKRILGLSSDQVKVALNRNYSIPIIFNGNYKEKINLIEQIKYLGLNIQFGGRVLNLGDNVDKGISMNILLDLLKKINTNKVITIGIGDNQNDLEMLHLSDYPCLILNQNNILKKNMKKKYITSKKPSPLSWIDVVKKSLKKIDLDLKV